MVYAADDEVIRVVGVGLADEIRRQERRGEERKAGWRHVT